jgi:hypothetical protein
MRTTGKGLYKWLKQQKDVKWPKHGGGLVVYLTYNDVSCAGMISKTHCGGRLIQTSISIRPMQSIHDIGNGAGAAVFMSFVDDANKKHN